MLAARRAISALMAGSCGTDASSGTSRTAADPKTGALGGAYSLPDLHAHNHELTWHGGLLAEQSGDMLRAFFRSRRGAGSGDGI